MHDSYTALGGGVPLLNMVLGEIRRVASGPGLYGILVVAIVAVFIAGLMVGRTPEYLGKKLGARDDRGALHPGHAGAGAAGPAPPWRTGRLDATATRPPRTLRGALRLRLGGNNNGSAFAGITVNRRFFHTTLAVAMLIGRFVPILVVLGLAGSVARRSTWTRVARHVPTTSALFGGLLAGVIVIVTALTYFPALALGPIAEALT